jgi:hypothetical protein
MWAGTSRLLLTRLLAMISMRKKHWSVISAGVLSMGRCRLVKPQAML